MFTAWATGLQILGREIDSVPLALERRLLPSYLVAFAAVFLVAAVVVRFAFVTVIDQQTASRLQDVARAGLRSILFLDDGFEIDKAEIARRGLLTPDQGLQWFDRRGRLVGTEGLTPAQQTLPSEGRRELSVGLQRLDSVTMPVLKPRTHQRIGTIRASEWNERERADIRYLDAGIFIATLLAIVGSGAGGLALTRRAVQPVEQTFQTLREFTANASHELRGPLTAIAASADAALRDPVRDPNRDRSRFETIGNAAKQMSRLSSDLLLLAAADRSLEHELYVVDLRATLDTLANQYRPAFAEAGIGLNVRTETAATVYGNPDQIERIVSNLLENARRYTPAGGQVLVQTKKSGTEIQVVVRDSGIGIAPEHLERVFERFWRADPVRSPGGVGLGLSIARALARRHGGDVTVTSTVGQGSRFVVTFPIRPPSHRLRG
jgi:two-component system, OmpR family, manganese sensing sensor histidine kinase